MGTGQNRLSTITSRRLLAGTCLAAFMAFSGPALAQDNTQPDQSTAQSPSATPTAAQPAQASKDELGTIIVTARYIKEDLQRAPVSISTKTSAELSAANISNINTLGAVVPNLYTHPGDADESGSPTIAMRGVVQNDASFARAPAVAIYVDGVYHATSVGSSLDLTDIDHIEVNRGPQSTLSGNASIGGAISIYTKEPQGDGSGFVSMGYGSRNEVTASGAIDLGLTPTLALRVSGHFKRQDGYVNLLDFTCEMNALGTPALAGSFPTGQPDAQARGCKIGELGGQQRAGGRVKLRWRPNDKLEINLAADIQRLDDQESPELAVQITNPYPNPSGLVNVYNQAIENQFGIRYDDRFLAPQGKPYTAYSTFCRPLLQGVVQQAPYEPTPSGFCFPRNKAMSSDTYSARVNYDFADNVHLTAIGAYYNLDNAFTQNGDESPLGYVLSHFTQRVHQKTGELRLDGTFLDKKLTWVVGAFGMGYKGYSDGFIGYITDNFTEYDSANNQSYSGFFHLDYKLTSKWRISGGARWTYGKLAYHLNHPGLIVVTSPFTATEKRWDWLLSTDYQITDAVMAYATVATGSRPPGVTTIVITPQQVTATPTESMTSYEVGLKSEFLQHRVRMNLSAFYEDYSSIATTEQGVQCLGELPGATWQASAATCATLYPGNPSSVPWYITTGTPAKIKGVEWDITATPVYHLLLSFSGGYNHFESDVKTPGAPGYLHAGNHLQPAWNMHASVQYQIDTPIGSFTPHLDWSWQSQQDFDPAPGAEAPQPQYIIAPYSLWNAQISYKPYESKWSATFAVSNLANKFYYYQLFGGGVVNISSVVAPPREFSLTLRRDF